jgi:hypothetical protein
LRAGSTPDDGEWLANLRPSEVDGLGSRDAIAGRYLHLYLTPGMLLRGDTRMCFWVPTHAGREVDRSPELRRRADEVTRHRGPESVVPPWRFAVDRQPDREYFAVPRMMPVGLLGIVVARFNPEVIAGDQVWVLDANDAEVTAAIMMSRAYRVWASGSRRVTVRAHDTFPCPELTLEQQHTLEACVEEVLRARQYAMETTLDDLYRRDPLPDPLAYAHRRLDDVVADILGVESDVSDVELAAHLRRLAGLA